MCWYDNSYFDSSDLSRLGTNDNKNQSATLTFKKNFKGVVLHNDNQGNSSGTVTLGPEKKFGTFSGTYGSNYVIYKLQSIEAKAGQTYTISGSYLGIQGGFIIIDGLEVPEGLSS